MYGLGVAVADYDNDGNIDIYITALGPNHLFRNVGGGKFKDVTAPPGVGDPGLLDQRDVVRLRQRRQAGFVRRQLRRSGRSRQISIARSTARRSRTARRNRTRDRARRSTTIAADGTFEDVTRKAGLYDPTCKSLGVALIDYDNDGWLDLFVANDTQPNRLYRNQRRRHLRRRRA